MQRRRIQGEDITEHDPRITRECPSCGRRYSDDVDVCPDDGASLLVELSDALIGAVIGGTYRITCVMTTGGMGRLYEAEHTRLSRRFVVKVTNDAHSFHRESLERAKRETQAISRIRSDHVVDVFDLLNTADGRPCMVTDFLEGEDLRTRLERRGKLDVDEALVIARQMCLGVGTAHDSGVVHRDLKPSNVFLAQRHEGREVVKLLDFGVAKVQGGEDLTQTGELLGTPAYMAPEQALSAMDVDERADIYAIGAVLYHMVSGQPPYGNEDATVTLMGLLKGEPPRVRTIESSVPEWLEAVIEQAMARYVESRPATARELEEKLASFTLGATEDNEARRAEGRHEADALSRSARWIRPLAFLLVVMAVGLTAAWVAAFVRTAVLPHLSMDELQETERTALVASPAVVGLVLGLLALRSIFVRWRSGPRVARFSSALRRGMWWGLGLFALIELGYQVWRMVVLVERPVMSEEHALALGISAAVAFVVFFAGKGSRV